jgi:hypothetical protein
MSLAIGLSHNHDCTAISGYKASTALAPSRQVTQIAYGISGHFHHLYQSMITVYRGVVIPHTRQSTVLLSSVQCAYPTVTTRLIRYDSFRRI